MVWVGSDPRETRYQLQFPAALNVLAMNLEKLLELLFVLFSALLCLLLVNDGSYESRSLQLKPQLAAA